MKTNKDIDSLVKRVYAKKGWRGVKEEAPWLRKAQITGRAKKLRISAPLSRPTPGLTDEQKELIRKFFAGGHKFNVDCEAFFRSIGANKYYAWDFAKSEQITRHGSIMRFWSDREVQIVKRTALLSLKQAAAELEANGFIRSCQSIARARNRYAVGANPDGEKTYSVERLSKALGCDSHTIHRYIKSGALKVRPGSLGDDGIVHTWIIHITDVVDWLENRASKIIKQRCYTKALCLLDEYESLKQEQGFRAP